MRMVPRVTERREGLRWRENVGVGVTLRIGMAGQVRAASRGRRKRHEQCSARWMVEEAEAAAKETDWSRQEDSSGSGGRTSEL